MELEVIDALAFGPDRIEALPGRGVRIGAAVRTSELAADPRIGERYPVVSQALLSGASGQLRIGATIAGNLLQRTTAVAAHPSDLALAFAALDAVVRTAGPDGSPDVRVALGFKVAIACNLIVRTRGRLR